MLGTYLNNQIAQTLTEIEQKIRLIKVLSQKNCWFLCQKHQHRIVQKLSKIHKIFNNINSIFTTSKYKVLFTNFSRYLLSMAIRPYDVHLINKSYLKKNSEYKRLKIHSAFNLITSDLRWYCTFIISDLHSRPLKNILTATYAFNTDMKTTHQNPKNAPYMPQDHLNSIQKCKVCGKL